MRLAVPCVLVSILLAACSSSDSSSNPGAGGKGGSSSGGKGGSSGKGGSAGNAGSGGSGNTSGSGGSATGGSSGTGGGANGDQFGPFAGGADYYKKWSHGPSTDPSFFPITVWLQSPSSAPDFKAIGINTFVGLYNGPTDQMLSDLSSAGMPVACDQNSVGLAHVADPTIIAWTQQDEPDNAQPAPGGGYGPCIAASEVQNLYNQFVAADSTRPVFLNLGQGVANQTYIGWGSECSQTHPGDYPDYVAASDIISFDIYPDNETDVNIHGNLYYVGDGVQHLYDWSQGKKAVWNWIECTGIDDPSGKPSPEDVKAEVWMSIVHGSMGIGYFVHQFNPSFDEHALLDDPTMKAAVAAINQQIKDLAAVLNTPPIINGGSVSSSDPNTPVDMRLLRQGGATYIFAVAMRRSSATATFSGLTNIPASASVTVLGENRTITLANASFSDDFDPYGVHLYQIQ